MRFAIESFKELFCAHYCCVESEYEVQALLRLIHREAQTLARLVWKLNPAFFSVDYDILQMLGVENSRDAVLQRARRIEREYRARNHFGWVRQVCLLWISPEQVIYTGMRLWPKSEIILPAPNL